MHIWLTYSLEHKKHGEMIAYRELPPKVEHRRRWCVWVRWDGMDKHTMGRKGGVSRGRRGCPEGLLLIRGVPVKIVGHEENVGARRDEGMARFHNLKAQETECTHQFSTVISVLVKADKHANNFQMFFSILQESRKALLTAFRKRVKRNLHVECAAAQDSIPLYCLGNSGTTLEVEYPGATVPCWLLCYSQLSVWVERPSWRSVIPCAIPSPTWDLQGWERGIRSTTEAPDTGYCNSGSTSWDWRYFHFQVYYWIAQ